MVTGSWLICSQIYEGMLQNYRLFIPTLLFPAAADESHRLEDLAESGMDGGVSLFPLAVSRSLQMVRGDAANQTFLNTCIWSVSKEWMRQTRACTTLLFMSSEIQWVIYFSLYPLINCPLYVPLHFFLLYSLFSFKRSSKSSFTPIYRFQVIEPGMLEGLSTLMRQ